MNVRSISEGQWCWQSKVVRRRIREAFDATNNVATALSVYDALCEIASDEQAETFTTTHAWIQRLSGVGVSTIKKHLGVFADMALIKVSTPTLRAPSTYVLLSLANGCPTLANSEPTLANATQSGGLATSEESQKNPRRQEGEGAPSPSDASLVLTDDQRAAIAADVRLPVESIDGCLRAFNVAKANWPNDPRTADAFTSWLTSSKAGKAALQRALGDGWDQTLERFGHASTEPRAPDSGPPGWQSFVDMHLQGAHSTGGLSHGPWHLKDQASRDAIVKAMTEHSENRSEAA